MDQADDNSLTALLTKKDPSKVLRDHKYMHRKVSRKNAFNKRCEYVNGLCPAGWLNEQSITKHWFQSVRTCPYSWATGRNSG